MTMSFRYGAVLSLSILIWGIGCSKKDKAENRDEVAKSVDVKKESDLKGIIFPKAVVQLKVGNFQERTGLHFVDNKRDEARHECEVNGQIYIVAWTYLGSSDQSDRYQFVLTRPSDSQEPIQKEISYAGGNGIMVYFQSDVAAGKEYSVEIFESIDSD